MKKSFSASAVLVLVFISSCTSLPKSILEKRTSANSIYDILQIIDDEIEKDERENISFFRIPGYPYLRTNRVTSHLLSTNKTVVGQRELIDKMRSLDDEIRSREIHTLSSTALIRIGNKLKINSSREIIYLKAQKAALALYNNEKEVPDFIQSVKENARVPDEYSNAMRIAGLYPAASIPVGLLTHRARIKFKQWYTSPLSETINLNKIVTYSPDNKKILDKKRISSLLKKVRSKNTGLYNLKEKEILLLAKAYAPHLKQETEGTFDIPGRVFWQKDSLSLDTSRPSMYYYTSHTVINNTPHIQIVYVYWFEKRTGKRPPLIEKGNFDGLTIRFTLNQNGKIIMVDGMNNCGCYHFFIPGRQFQQKEIPEELDSFVPQKLPLNLVNRSIAIHVISGWHQPVRFTSVKASRPDKLYTLIPYEKLEMLKKGIAQKRSMFDSRAIGYNSKRYEYILLFPMGVYEIGSMRQRGKHPTKLVGREHFDDPLIINNNFTIIDK